MRKAKLSAWLIAVLLVVWVAMEFGGWYAMTKHDIYAMVTSKQPGGN